jgi:hypothetical protein
MSSKQLKMYFLASFDLIPFSASFSSFFFILHNFYFLSISLYNNFFFFYSLFIIFSLFIPFFFLIYLIFSYSYYPFYIFHPINISSTTQPIYHISISSHNFIPIIISLSLYYLLFIYLLHTALLTWDALPNSITFTLYFFLILSTNIIFSFFISSLIKPIFLIFIISFKTFFIIFLIYFIFIFLNFFFFINSYNFFSIISNTKHFFFLFFNHSYSLTKFNSSSFSFLILYIILTSIFPFLS